MGSGDHGRVMADVARAAGRMPDGFVQPDQPLEPGDFAEVDGIRVLGSLSVPSDLRTIGDDVEFVVALGANRARAAGFQRSLELGWRPVVLVHPSVVLLGNASIGPGSQVCAGAVIGVSAVIGSDVIVNTLASVDHDARIGNHAFIGPGAVLAGRVTIQDGGHVGIGAVIREGCTIGAWSFVAAGAVVVRDVPPGLRVAGVPARPMDDPDPPEENA